MAAAKHVKHQRSVASTLSDIWSRTSEFAMSRLANSQYVANLSEAAVVKALQNITQGTLVVATPTFTYRLPANEDRPQRIQEPEVKIQVQNHTFFLRLLTSTDMGFAEAYMFGDIDVATNQLTDVFRLFILNNRAGAFTSLTGSYLTRLFSIPAQLTAGRFVANLDNSRANISAHYDLGNEIFKTFLSADMTYSCGIFPSLDADLKEVHQPSVFDPLFDAQMRKLRHIIQKADIKPGQRVLEIGSGWGSLALLIAESIEGTTVDTLTLSSQQAEYVREQIAAKGLEARIKVHLMDYRSMPPQWKGVFDRVVSVEMLEAVGREFYETYFAKIDWALKKDTGVGVVQGITIPESRYPHYVKTEDFIRKWPQIFPGAILPTLTQITSAITAASSGRLLVESVTNIGPHYARTLREWRRRFDAGFDEDGSGSIERALIKEYPDVMGGQSGRAELEVFKRKWLYYFCYCEAGFATRLLGVHIVTFVREGYVDYGCHTFN